MLETKTSPQKNIYLFLSLTLTLSCIFYYLLIHLGKLRGAMGLYAMGIMWCPGIATWLTYRVFKRDFSSLAWGWGKPGYQLWGYLTPLFYALVGYLFIWLTGAGGFYNKEFINETTTSFGWTGLPPSLVIVFYFVLLAIYKLPSGMASALGEEIGWRGFLVPELMKITSYTRTSFIVGIIWALWHFPVLVFGDYNNGAPAWYGMTCFAVMVISDSFIFTWFRLKSKSIWPSVLLHPSHNLFVQLFFTPITQDTGNTKYYIDEFGAVLPVISVLLAIYFWSRQDELKEQE